MRASKRKYPLNQSPLFKLGNHRRLAELLKIDQKALRKISRLDASGYAVWTETSASGKARVIENPYPRIKRVQSRLSVLLNLIEPPEFLTCPVKGRSYVSNARHHVGSRQIVTLDVSAYFPSTTWKRVYWFFSKRMEMAPDVAWTLASLSTMDGHLPTGSPLSPILSYFAHEDIWLSVMRKVEDASCRMTLYMDDVTVSGDLVSETLIWSIKQVIHSAGLRLNNKKQRRYTSEALITGVVVTRDGARPTKGSHLKLKKLQDEYKLELDVGRRARLGRSLKGMRSQHRQVSKQSEKLTAV